MNTVLLMLLLLAGTGVYWTQKAIDARAGQFRSTEEVLYLPSGKVIKTLSLGHNGLLADVYWMRAVQYYGGKRLKNEKRFDLLDPLIGIATTLDPQLIHAYRFGAIFLSERSPVGAEQPEKALALLKQGIERNPDEWQLYRDLGFVYYWYLQDYKKGAEAFLEGSKNPKSAAWMKTFAAELMAKGGSRESARFLWQQFYDTADNEQMKRNARENLIRLQALDEMDILRDFISKIEARLGRPVESIEELVKLGLLKQHSISALIAARWRWREQAGGTLDRTRGLLLASGGAHSSVAQAARAMDADVVTVPADEFGRLTRAALRSTVEAMSDDERERLFAIVVTCGTTNVGVIDDLRAAADVAAELGTWLHVDGAYGGAALAAPSVRDRFDGVEAADSFIVDPHKWLFAPFDSCALIYRDPEIGRAAHTQHAEYLDVLHAEQGRHERGRAAPP